MFKKQQQNGVHSQKSSFQNTDSSKKKLHPSSGKGVSSGAARKIKVKLKANQTSRGAFNQEQSRNVQQELTGCGSIMTKLGKNFFTKFVVTRDKEVQAPVVVVPPFTNTQSKLKSKQEGTSRNVNQSRSIMTENHHIEGVPASMVAASQAFMTRQPFNPLTTNCEVASRKIEEVFQCNKKLEVVAQSDCGNRLASKQQALKAAIQANNLKVPGIGGVTSIKNHPQITPKSQLQISAMGPISHHLSKDEVIRSSKDGYHTRKQSVDKENRACGENAPIKQKVQQNIQIDSIPFQNTCTLQDQAQIELKKAKESACQIQFQILLQKDQIEYIFNYEDSLLRELSQDESIMIDSALECTDRCALFTWLTKVSRKSNIQDANVPFLAQQLIDHYLAVYYPQSDKIKPDLQIIGIVGIFISTKILEISYFDLRFCTEVLGHNKYTKDQILALEDRFMTVTNWNFTQSTQLDILNVLISMLKVRTNDLISTVLHQVFVVEFDAKLLTDLKHTLCIPKLTRMKPFLKLVSMLSYKIMKLRDYIRVEFPNNQVIFEINTLTQNWIDIFHNKIQMLISGASFETVCNCGRSIYVDIEVLQRTLSQESLHGPLAELRMIK